MENPHLVHGKYSIKDLINVESLRKTLEDFSLATGFTVGLVEHPSQSVLIATGWRDICTKFHRVFPESRKYCKKSNLYLTEQLKGLKKIRIKTCGNGLVDGATPIVIKGKHLASLFTGQIFFEKPNMDQFKKQAEVYGYDSNKYLEALGEVPIVSENQFRNILSFLSKLAVSIAETGLNNLELKEKRKKLEEEIIDRKRSEKALRESEKRYRDLADSLPQIVFETNLKGDLTFANRIAHDIFGYLKDDFDKGLNVIQMVIPEDRKRVIDNIQKTLMGKGKGSEEYTALRADGGTFPIEVHPVPIIRQGKPGGFRGVIVDLSNRKHAHEALLESEGKFRLISEQSLLAIGIIQDGCIKYANEMYSKITGYSLEEIYGWEPFGYARTVHKDDLAFVMEQSSKKQVGDKGVVTNYQFKGFTKTEDIVWWDLFSKTIVYHGRPADLFTLVDITDRIKTEKDKEALEKQLQNAQKMEAIGTLAGGIAHDFNNLLMAIQSRTSMILMNKDSSHADLNHLKGIESHVESATDLTRQLLGFARGGKYEVRPTDLNELIKKENRMFGRTKKEITIYEKFEENLWPTEVDRGQIQQVLLNLYVNAWQAMPGGGNLYLETENSILTEDYVKSFSVESGRYVRMSVTDTGIGMEKAIQEKIFDPFFTTKEPGRGTGLGLASVYGIIKNHGGIINVFSEKGKGTTFNVYLPRSEKEVVIDKKAAGETLKGSETVLFVDDEEMITEVAEDMLELLGYKTMIARSGKEAVEIYKERNERIDMVILDMIMPDMSGGEAYDRMKDINPKVKVLLSSGYSTDRRVDEILNRGCDGFIQKPFKMKKLSQKLRDILDEKNDDDIL